GFASAEAEFVPVGTPPVPRALTAPAAAGECPPSPPTEEAAAAARKFWLKAIRRFTEPVPEKKGRLRVRHSGNARRSAIRVETRRVISDGRGVSYPQRVRGDEADVADKLFLLLFAEERDPDGGGEVTQSTTAIPWTDIGNVSFEVTRSAEPEPQ